MPNLLPFFDLSPCVDTTPPWATCPRGTTASTPSLATSVRHLAPFGGGGLFSVAYHQSGRLPGVCGQSLPAFSFFFFLLSLRLYFLFLPVSGWAADVSYYDAVKLFTLLEESEDTSKSFFGSYSSARLAEWDAIIKEYVLKRGWGSGCFCCFVRQGGGTGGLGEGYALRFLRRGVKVFGFFFHSVVNNRCSPRRQVRGEEPSRGGGGGVY